MWTEFKMFWNQEFSVYKALSRILSKEAGYGANAAIQTNPNIHDLEEADITIGIRIRIAYVRNYASVIRPMFR
eukprot:3018791-Ditylum_brightwellii.AAC.1